MVDYEIPMVKIAFSGSTFDAEPVIVRLSDARRLLETGTYFPLSKYVTLVVKQGKTLQEIAQQYLPTIARLAAADRAEVNVRTGVISGIETGDTSVEILVDATPQSEPGDKLDRIVASLRGESEQKPIDQIEAYCRTALVFIDNYMAKEAAAEAGE